jgi:uncharacterized integral membrane protein
MPWRLVGFIIFFGIVLVFSIFNRNNSSDIFLGFFTLKEVPVYLTVFASFLAGLVCSLPYAIAARIKARKAKQGSKPAKGEKFPVDGGGKKGAGKAGSSPGENGESVYSDDGSYGID